MVPPVGKKKSMGRQRIEIKLIQDDDRRLTTFSKRKSGLFKKVSEISVLCGALAAAIVFSKTDKLSAHGNPSVDHVLRRAAPLPGEDDALLVAALDDADAVAEREAVEALARQCEEARALVAAEQARMAAIGAKVLEAAAGRQFWWEADVEALGEEELPEFTRALQRLRRMAAEKLPLVSAPPPAAAPLHQ